MKLAAVISAAVLGFALSALLGIKLVPWLHKLKFGQTILDIGPNWHKQKQGTPTMGGFMFIIGTTAAFLVVVLVAKAFGYDLVGGESLVAGAEKAKIYGGLIMALGFGLIGFADDYIKVRKEQNEGLTVIQKTLLQLLLCAAYIATLILSGNVYMYIPFAGTWDYGNTFVHVFVPEFRERYNLEQLWADARINTIPDLD